jgi:addiction module HigA family antidote
MKRTSGKKKGGEAAWNIHPSEVLREEFLRPLEMSSYELAKRVRVPAPRINDIVLEKRGITADTTVRLARFFGTTEGFLDELVVFLRNSSRQEAHRKGSRTDSSANREIGGLVEGSWGL